MDKNEAINRTKLIYDPDGETRRQKFLITMINMLKPLMAKADRQYMRTCVILAEKMEIIRKR